TSAKTAFHKALGRAGIEDFHWHDLRHCAATRWRRAGMSIDRIKELLGHSSLGMVMRYASLYPDDLIKAMAAFEEKKHGTPTAHQENAPKLVAA
ncbi:MAG: hypothetical protein FJX42_02275, partial [Alphaproteobacteria bacterium]|nr:hypothetical protein [Alphaproteobacteria bacterium]